MNLLRTSLTGVSLFCLLAACSSEGASTTDDGITTGNGTNTGDPTMPGLNGMPTGSTSSGMVPGATGAGGLGQGSTGANQGSTGAAQGTNPTPNLNPPRPTGEVTTPDQVPGVNPSPTGGAGGTPAVNPSEPGAVGGAPVTGPGEPTSPEPDGVDPVETPFVRPSLVTSAQGAYWQLGEYAEVAGGNATVTVNESQEFQEWLGFGGTFNEAGWDALSVLDAADRDRAIQLLFSETDGAGLDWGRIPMGSSDYGMSRYSYSDTPDDWEMANFSIERDREMMIPYIKAALTYKPDVRLWGSPWSPPPWMKSNNDYNGGSMRNEPEVLQAYALYFARFVEEYAAEGLTIDHVHPQNEPGYVTRYPSCSWGATSDGIGTTYLGSFVGNYLGPTFEERGLEAEIWFGTLSNADTYSAYMNGLDATAASYVVGVGLQWNTMSNTQQLSNQGYLVMQTEHKCGNYPWEGGFNAEQPPNDHAYAEESWDLIKQWLEAGVHIYSAWNMVLDTRGQNLDEERPWPQNALLAVDRGTQTLLVTPAYYVFRHVSQYVDVGARRIGVQGGDALAFENPDGSIVTVLRNTGGQAAQTTLAVGGSTLQFEVPGRGWATVIREAQ